MYERRHFLSDKAPSRSKETIAEERKNSVWIIIYARTLHDQKNIRTQFHKMCKIDYSIEKNAIQKLT